MTLSNVLTETAIVALRRLPLYCLCIVGAAAPIQLFILTPSRVEYLAPYAFAALTTVVAIMGMPAHAIATWIAACQCEGGPIRFREMVNRLLKNVIALTLLAVMPSLGWHLLALWREILFPFTVYLILCAVLAYILLRCSIAFPIALLEDRSATASLAQSWRRMRLQWLAAGGIVGFYLMTIVVLILFSLFASQHGPTVQQVAIFYFAHAAIQVLWTISMACLYVHVSPGAANLSPDALGSPSLDAPNQDGRYGEPGPHRDLHGIARNE